ncbi:MAG: hypothetical protein WC657_06880 [Candidatus Paceibacterota bacterium]
MELNDIFGGNWLLLWQLLAAGAGTALALALVAFAMKYVAKYASDIRGYVVRYRKGVVEQVDDVNDPLIKQLAKLFRVPESVLITVLPAFLNALADGILASVGGERMATVRITEADVRNIAQAEALKVVRTETDRAIGDYLGGVEPPEPVQEVNIGGAVPQ